MTNNKMIKILESYEDTPLWEVVDAAKYDFEKDAYTYPVRDVVLLSDVIEEFKAKQGQLFNAYKFTDAFKDLVKLIESGKPGDQILHEYEDSKQEKLDNWSKYHPDETEEQFKKRLWEEDHKRYKEMMRMAEHTWDLQTPWPPVYLMHNYRRGW